MPQQPRSEAFSIHFSDFFPPFLCARSFHRFGLVRASTFNLSIPPNENVPGLICGASSYLYHPHDWPGFECMQGKKCSRELEKCCITWVTPPSVVIVYVTRTRTYTHHNGWCNYFWSFCVCICFGHSNWGAILQNITLHSKPGCISQPHTTVRRLLGLYVNVIIS